MTTFFLFTDHLDEEQALCLSLDDQGKVSIPLAIRPLAEVRAIQMNARTIIVLPTEISSLHLINLPWLGERKAREAIPFALEEHLAQSVTTLHFAFDRDHYSGNHYLIAVIDKQVLTNLMTKLDALDLDFDEMTLDWFALLEQEACITNRALLVRDDAFKGALSAEFAAMYLKDKEKGTQVLRFTDSLPPFKSKKFMSLDTSFHTWVAQRLFTSKHINLCQGEFQRDNRQKTSSYWYRMSGMVAAVLIVSMVLFKVLHVHVLNEQIAAVDKKIAVIYRQFFPQASQIISPRFRIAQLLKGGNGDSTLWLLLDKLTRAIGRDQTTIQQFRFPGRVLAVTLLSRNFAELEALQSRLQKEHVKVSQAQASSHEKEVMATLELSL
jgi:general secretion pathway protein L